MKTGLNVLINGMASEYTSFLNLPLEQRFILIETKYGLKLFELQEIAELFKRLRMDEGSTSETH